MLLEQEREMGWTAVFVKPFHPKECFAVNFFGHTESTANLFGLKPIVKTIGESRQGSLLTKGKDRLPL